MKSFTSASLTKSVLFTHIAGALLCGACAKTPASNGAAVAEPTTSGESQMSAKNAEPPSTETAAAQSAAAQDAPRAAGSSGEAEAESPEPATPMPREVRYIQGAGGLKIEVEGVRIIPSAKPEKNKWGWGVEVSVQVESLDGEEHSLLNSKRGPLAFAGKVHYKGGKLIEFSDEREGEDEALITEEASMFERSWPEKKGARLGYGQTLELDVGLWGLGTNAETRRPVRKLFRLKMAVGNQKPQPVIMPPELAEQ